MSEITTRIEQYLEGATDWPALRDWLVNYRWVTPQRYVDPQPGPLDERDWDHTYVVGSWDEMDFYVVGSWDEMDFMRAKGLLTDAQYHEVSRAIDARHRSAQTGP
jgi:hypothetical protein